MIIVVCIMDKNIQLELMIDMDWEKFTLDKGTESLELNVIDVINTDIKNILGKKLEEEKRQREIAQKRLKKRKAMIQKARITSQKRKINSVFWTRKKINRFSSKY